QRGMRLKQAFIGAVLTSASPLCLPALGQSPERDFSTYRPSVEPTRIDKADAPKIDGVLDDPIWEQVATLSEFYQVQPTIEAPAVETLVYLAYSEDALYVGIHAFDDEPENIRASIMQRDGDVWRDDMVRFYIDPFDTGLSGFGFDVNSLGARLDRLIQPNRRPIDEWDIIWGSAGQRTEDGWTAEFSIPFRSINFDPEAEAWGLLITRERSHKNQQIRWAGIDQSLTQFNFVRSGRMVGIENVNQGRGLELDLQAAVIGTRDWPQPRNDEYEIEPSGTLRYQFTPGLTGLVTVNTDFSDTPLDNREINTGRFSLFFPETRDFFLQDAAFFEFGGDTFNGQPNGQPFFSRRIGIVSGQSVPLDGGVKLSGEYAGFEVGILSAFTSETDTLDPQTLSVARITRDLFGDDRMGLVATAGDPTGDSENQLFGLDYLLQTPSFFGGERLQADVFYQASFSDQVDDDESYGARLNYPNDKWNWRLEYRHIGEDFDPALGFVNRPGTKTYRGQWHRRYRPSGGPLRYWQFGTGHEHITDLDGDLETREDALELRIETAATDEIRVDFTDVEERVDTPFSLPGGLIVPAGVYANDEVSVSIDTSRTRPVEVQAALQTRDFFGGEAEGYEIELLLRPNRFLDLQIGYEREDISVPAGDVSVQVGSIETVVNFNPNLSISTQTQYDNLSESLSVFGRMRWELRPQTELFASIAHGALIEGSDFGRNFRSVQSRSVVRIGNTFRF
ncbi:MAG: carbohydrate binding family 9 domain-containing protein, partial [Pseudomonadota bacterium]